MAFKNGLNLHKIKRIRIRIHIFLLTLCLGLCSNTNYFEETYLSIEDLKCKPVYSLPQALSAEDKADVYRLQTDFVEFLELLQLFPNLQALELLDVGSTVPVEIQELAHLRIVDLSKNAELQNIEALGNLPHLEEFALASVTLRELPQKMASLSNIQRVEIRVGKELRDIRVLENFTCMSYLELSDCNNLEQFPSHLPALKHLKTSDIFTLVNIQLVLQKGQNIDSLTQLDMNACGDIQAATPFIQNFKGLKKLNLSSNPNLKHVQYLKNLMYLEDINLSYCNQLEEIPASFSSLKNLKYVNLSFNSRLKDISGLAGLPLKSLILPNIELLKTLPEEDQKRFRDVILVIKNNLRQEGVVYY